ncbi:hypothetical protein [Alteromonas oceanisediminis]|uniref:hypothetical protein n=1 Tax=Alteromonas oceanisediminis TaxID=2836180 RepID=UPI001BD93C77|nr:hypothetical protein [Alteromonas oceanisediminis]MBT0585358.1 hypothetical protein [Alteromonas oceanisediminis]
MKPVQYTSATLREQLLQVSQRLAALSHPAATQEVPPMSSVNEAHQLKQDIQELLEKMRRLTSA